MFFGKKEEKLISKSTRYPLPIWKGYGVLLEMLLSPIPIIFKRSPERRIISPK